MVVISCDWLHYDSVPIHHHHCTKPNIITLANQIIIVKFYQFHDITSTVHVGMCCFHLHCTFLLTIQRTGPSLRSHWHLIEYFIVHFILHFTNISKYISCTIHWLFIAHFIVHFIVHLIALCCVPLPKIALCYIA